MSCKEIDDFLRSLKRSPSGAVFNPWWQVDSENDAAQNAPAIRRKQLRAYLQQRLGKARLAIIGEALGYRGGHFSGIPMTSERLLLGKQKHVVAALYSSRRSRHPAQADESRTLQQGTRSGGHPDKSGLQIIATIKPHRTSKPRKCPDGFSESTATIVWGTLLKLGLHPEQFLLWNAFPWHSFDSRRGMLSNRMPNKSERAAGLPVLRSFLDLFPCDQIVALGKIAAAQLQELGINAHRVRHPACGGAKLFREQIAKIVNK
jgi:uracil-DNA glycosylase